MWYAQIKTLPSAAELTQRVDDALKRKNWSRNDLIDKLGFPYRAPGHQALDKLFRGDDNRPLLRRIAKHLDIPLVEVTGERAFDQQLEYRMFTFVPTLVRVPESTRPRQILPVAMAGVDYFLRAGRYPELLDAPPAERDRLMAEVIPRDYADHPRTIFDDVTGYALFYAFGQAQGYGVDGRRLDNVSVDIVNVSTFICSGKHRLSDGRGVIARLIENDRDNLIKTGEHHG